MEPPHTPTAPPLVVAGATSATGDQTPEPAPDAPSPLLYGAVAIVGLGVVLAGGWLYVNRPWTR
jgi:hypothetical protein